MKRIVNGLLYDTDISILIHHETDTSRILYQTINGNFYMFYPNGEVVPKTLDSVKDYLGKRNTEKYIELFGQPQEA